MALKIDGEEVVNTTEGEAVEQQREVIVEQPTSEVIVAVPVVEKPKFVRLRESLESVDAFNAYVACVELVLLPEYKEDADRRLALAKFQLELAQISVSLNGVRQPWITNATVIYTDIAAAVMSQNIDTRAETMASVYLGLDLDQYVPFVEAIMSESNAQELIFNYLVDNGVHPTELDATTSRFKEMIQQGVHIKPTEVNGDITEAVEEAIKDVKKITEEAILTAKPVYSGGPVVSHNDWSTTDTILTIGGVLLLAAAAYWGYQSFAGCGDECDDVVVIG